MENPDFTHDEEVFDRNNLQTAQRTLLYTDGLSTQEEREERRQQRQARQQRAHAPEQSPSWRERHQEAGEFLGTLDSILSGTVEF